MKDQSTFDLEAARRAVKALEGRTVTLGQLREEVRRQAALMMRGCER